MKKEQLKEMIKLPLGLYKAQNGSTWLFMPHGNHAMAFKIDTNDIKPIRSYSCDGNTDEREYNLIERLTGEKYVNLYPTQQFDSINTSKDESV